MSRKLITFAKQGGLPTRQKLLQMYNEASKAPGCTVELPFGEGSESYSLTVLRDRTRGEYAWMLYRGEGAASALEWTHVTTNAEQIFNLLWAQFPGWEKPRLLAEEKGEIWQDQFSSRSHRALSEDKTALEGSLSNLSVPNILQSLMLGSLSGRLEVRSPSDLAHIYLEEGVPLHCAIRGASGDDAIIELMSWEEGEFKFYPGERTTEKTVKKRIESLSIEGVTFQDQWRYIQRHGFKIDKRLVRTFRGDEKEFDEALASGTGYDISLQKQLFLAIDDNSSFAEVLRKCPLKKTQWVPILFNLMSCQLVQIGDPAVSRAERTFSSIDWSQATVAQKALSRPDTDIFSFSTCLFLLRQEFSRFQLYQRPFCLSIFEARLKRTDEEGKTVIDPLPSRTARAVACAVERLKRNMDWFAHFETWNYALIMPESTVETVEVFVHELVDSILCDKTLVEDFGQSISLKFGLASIPGEADTLDDLIDAARPRQVHT